MNAQQEPLVSIGIPTYNRAAKLRQAIEAILQQQHQNIEVIIGDNASSDDTKEVSESFCARDSRIVYYRQPENIGPVGNFKTVLSKAQGRYFMWHADDYQLVDRNFISRLSSTMDEDVFLSFPLFVLSNLGANKSREFFSIYESAHSKYEYFLAWCKHGAGYPVYGLFNRQALVESNYFAYYERCKDWPYHNEGLFLHKIFAEKKVRYCPEVQAYVNVKSTNTTANHQELLECFLLYTFEAIRQLEHSTLSREQKDHARAELYQTHIRHALKHINQKAGSGFMRNWQKFLRFPSKQGD